MGLLLAFFISLLLNLCFNALSFATFYHRICSNVPVPEGTPNEIYGTTRKSGARGACLREATTEENLGCHQKNFGKEEGQAAGHVENIDSDFGV